MKAQIIQIGNSQGLRIPKVLLEEARLSGEIELEVNAEGILIRRASKPREDWDAIFRRLADADDDHGADSGSGSSFDQAEWQW